MNRRFQDNEMIGDYRVVGFLGRGGMGEVYHFYQEQLNRSVAVKVLGSHVSLDETYKARFLNEARVQANLQHPNIVALYNFQASERELLIYMELVDGEGLDSLIERNYFSIEESLKVFEAIVDAIRYVHSNGIIHRDIKTENVKLNSAGIPKLLDFGIAKDPKSSTLTQIGGVIGTPNYLAPEQLDGKQASVQTDIWSLGVLLYKMLTKKMPFDDDWLQGLILKIVQGQYDAPETINSAIPKSVSNIIRKCLLKDVSQRYQTTDELLRDIRQVLNERYSHNTYLPETTQSKSFPMAKIFAIASSSLFLLSLIVVGVWALSGSTNVANTNNSNTRIVGNNSTPSNKKTTELPIVGQSSPKTESTLTTQQNLTDSSNKVRIDAIGGKTEVWRNGQKIGETPYDLNIAEKEVVNLTLKREGFLDHDVQVGLNVGKKVYTFMLAPK